MTGAGPTTIVVHLGDQRRSRTDSHGIINFSLGLVRALPGALRDDERLVVLVNDELADELGTGWLRDVDRLRTIPAPGSAAARLRVDHLTVGREAAAAQADVVLFPKGFLPLGPRRGARWVPCFHDDIPARALRDRALPLRRRVRAAYFTALLRRSVRRADQRLFVSAFTAGQLVGSARPWRTGDTVVHEGITLPFRPVRPLGDRRPQALLLGSPHPHKRTRAGLGLIEGDEAMAGAVERVVVLGHLGHPTERVGSLPVEHRPGPLEGGALADLIAESRVLVYPSSYEGFGLPPIEAYALGTPAVYRRTDAAREVLDDVPGGFDTEDPRAFGAAATEALSLGDAELAELSARMWERFDWAAVAERVAVALRSAAGHA